MRVFFFLLLCNVRVLGFFGLWNTSWLWKKENDNTYQNSLSDTGRVFVTMFGYPAKCERKGVLHSCTLSFTCWLVGGSSQSGCGASPWLVACCVTSKNKNVPHTKYNEYSRPQEMMNNGYDYEEVLQKLEEKEEFSKESGMQRRNDNTEEECGLSSDRILLKRIIGGNEAKFAQFPWQAHLRIAAYQCGGVLVSRRFVATAGHCIVRARLKDITVYLGELDTQDTGKVVELAPAELHRVKKKFVHPQFQFKTTQPDRYDIALLELLTDAGYSFHIVPICLPESGLILEGRNAVVAGWGKIIPSTELMGTNVLRSATVPILDIRECMSWHQTKQIVVDLHEEMICAGHEDGHQDACLGDSGGPLIILDNGRWTLVGITSAGFGCGEPHQPGIYHSVSVTANWIRSVIRSF